SRRPVVIAPPGLRHRQRQAREIALLALRGMAVGMAGECGAVETAQRAAERGLLLRILVLAPQSGARRLEAARAQRQMRHAVGLERERERDRRGWNVVLHTREIRTGKRGDAAAFTLNQAMMVPGRMSRR